MIYLSRYIELLLQENECVILPNFGAFVKQSMPARFIEAERLFFPPYLSVGFNPLLTENDGMLVHAYMKGKQLTYLQAQKAIETKITQLRRELVENGKADFGTLGTFKQESDGLIDFLPNESGILSTEQYGLGVFSIQPLRREKKHSVKTLKSVDIKRNDDKYTIRIKRRWVHSAATIAASILLFFISAVPVGNKTNQQQASFHNAVFDKLAQYTTQKINKEAPVITYENDTLTEAPAIELTKGDPPKEEVDEVVQPISKEYTIVLASAVSEKNANALIERLHDRGFCEAHLCNSKKIRRVHYGSYSTEQLAQSALRELRDVHEFGDAWIRIVK